MRDVGLPRNPLLLRGRPLTTPWRPKGSGEMARYQRPKSTARPGGQRHPFDYRFSEPETAAAGPHWQVRLTRFIDASSLSRPAEEPDVDSFAENVSLKCPKDVRAGRKGIAGRVNVEDDVQGLKLQYIVVEWSGSRSARPAIHRPRGADLIAPVGQLRLLLYTFRQSRRRRGNVPDQPMELVIRGPVSHHVDVVHMEDKALGSRWRVDPSQRWGRALSRSDSICRRGKLDRNLAAVGESGC
jgi:hypothetical protein